MTGVTARIIRRLLREPPTGGGEIYSRMFEDAVAIGDGFSNSVVSGEVDVGTLSHDGPATPEQISLWLPVTGTVSSTATATCEYKESSSGTWIDGHPLYRVRPSFSTSPAVGGAVADGFAWVILDLTPGTEYDVRVTVTDGANQSVKTLTHTTRALPAASGATTVTVSAGSTAAQIASAINGAAAGAVIELEDGTYNLTGSISITSGGGSGSTKYVRGASRTGVVLTRSTVGSFFSLNGDISDLVIERMTLEGNGVDQDGDSATSYTTVLDQQTDTTTQTRITLRNVTATGIDRGVYLYDGQGVLVHDNTLEGNNLWQTSPTNFLGSNRTWNDDGLNLAGAGNCGFNNLLKGFGDTTAYAQHVGNDVTHNGTAIHFYRNEIRNSCDDPIEVDHGRRNLTFYDNRCHNTINCDSIDPLYGGPWICARNIVINPYRVNTHKWNDTNTGQFLYNNTYVATESLGTDADVANWYQPNNGAQRSYGYRNNLHVYRGDGQSIWLESTTHNPIDWTHNAWYPNRQIQWGGIYANLAAAQAGLGATTPIFSGSTQRMANDVITVNNPWTTTVTLGATAATEVTDTYTPVLSSGDNAKNAGVAIPGITDGFTGAAPDIGAVIEGRSSVVYGDRSAVPEYISSMTDYQVRQMTGTYAPTNGNETMEDVTPSEWLTSDPASNQGLPSVINAWCGGGKGIGTKLIVHGGGHDDSANNGVYVFDYRGTTKPTGWTLPDISAVSAVVNASQTYSDGRPTSIHSYDGQVYAHDLDTFFRFGGANYNTAGGFTDAAFKYNFATDTWTQLPDYPGTPFPEATCCYDEASGKILVTFPDQANAAFYRIVANTWSSVKSASGAREPCMAYDHTRSRALLMGDGNAYRVIIDWSAETLTFASISATGATALIGDNALAAFYDEDADCFWIFGGGSASPGYGTIYRIAGGELDSTSGVAVTSHALSVNMAAAGFETPYNGSFGRFIFMRDWRAIGFVTRTDAAPYVIKLPEV